MDFVVIDDDKAFRDATLFLIEEEGHYAEGATNGDSALQRLKEEKFDAALLDLNLGGEDGLEVLTKITQCKPNLLVIMFSAEGSVKTAVEAMRRGAADFLEKPFTREQFHTTLARLNRLRQMGQRIERLEEEVKESRSQHPQAVFNFAAAGMKETMDVLMRAAATPASILILGESGTGKSVAARAVHENSHLSDKPFVTVSCPSLSTELLESELFGHVKGSFTGAVRDHWGKVKAAEGGTLFLDEIGDLPMEIQPKLLRLLQEREYERLGENITRKADVRVIAATNRDLKQRVAEGTFREDLFYRLNVIAVEMPPLRQRPSDLISFAEHYLEHFAAQCGRKVAGFDAEALNALRAHSWPGNLRELRNAIERAAILTRGERLTAIDLPAEVNKIGHMPGQAHSPQSPGTAAIQLGARETLEKIEEIHLRMILDTTKSLAEAAEVLGIDQATLYRKRKRLGLD
ncbi:MAG TPA: sigma-54 dependent transcriptional regulator [Candidatus Limnocylindria bacterium]|jgi:NtrC-family two-component system response regulator AlgB|nr:sigma-54 dependent transcriptional regulator [Candidatus Limnocylindria bacterium]